VAIVTRHADVREVLSRDSEFTVGHYASKMDRLLGRIILGLQNTPEYEHHISVLRLALPRTDMPMIKMFLDEILEEIVATACSAGELDVVADVCDRVPVRLSAKYFGVPGPDETTLLEWSRALFRELFYDVRNDPGIARPAARASVEMKQYVNQLLATRRKEFGKTKRDDVLERLLHLQADGCIAITDEWICTYLMGLIVGMVPLTSKATALAVDVILDRPTFLAAASAAARENNGRLWRYTSEAMRLAPQAPGQFRLAEGDWVIGSGRGRRYVIPTGTKVLVATQAAMFDPGVFRHPSKIRTDRPESQYLHFGYGLHSCYGRYISHQAQIPAIMRALLSRQNLRRASGQSGC